MADVHDIIVAKAERDQALMELRDALAERDQWIRLFNRLDAAITHHKRDTNPLWAAEPDEALWAARDGVLKDAAGPDTR